ncbi:hypothetical protein STEG23_037390, partial [Scotinomys teguina]
NSTHEISTIYSSKQTCSMETTVDISRWMRNRMKHNGQLIKINRSYSTIKDTLGAHASWNGKMTTFSWCQAQITSSPRWKIVTGNRSGSINQCFGLDSSSTIHK